MNIGTEILDIIKMEILQDESVDLELDSDLLTSGILDSMAVIRLVASIEEKYKIKIPPTELVIENFLNINSMQAFVMTKLSEN